MLGGGFRHTGEKLTRRRVCRIECLIGLDPLAADVEPQLPGEKVECRTFQNRHVISRSRELEHLAPQNSPVAKRIECRIDAVEREPFGDGNA